MTVDGGNFKMADECLTEFLHAEVVKYVANKSEEKGGISTLEYLGYITGFKIIETHKRKASLQKTNHHGIYVFQDNAFRYLVRLSSEKQHLEVAPKFLAFTCGIVRGALANLGIACLVIAEVEQMPACKFHIQLQRA